jgi:hypothetical protein
MGPYVKIASSFEMSDPGLYEDGPVFVEGRAHEQCIGTDTFVSG